MKYIVLATLLLVTLAGCKEKNARRTEEVQGLQEVFTKYNVKGSVLVYDMKNDKYIGFGSARWDTGFLPASTFKIPNTLIALETKVITPDTVFRWDGQKRSLAVWEQDMTLQQAFSLSCVPVYQDIARHIGYERMKEYVTRFEYGEMDVDQNNIDVFWLEGDSKISQFQQIDFLVRLYREKLPAARHNMMLVKQIMKIEGNDVYQLHAKTGWAVREGNNLGWFVGYVEKGGDVFFFATAIEPENEVSLEGFNESRALFTKDVLTYLGIIETV